MTLYAVLANGRRAPVAARHGTTIQELVASLTADTLTGSAAPLASAQIELQDGSRIDWPTIQRLEEDDRARD